MRKYSVIRAIAAIERCDVCVLMVDAAEGVTEQDKKIAGIAHEAGKGIIVVVNKWGSDREGHQYDEGVPEGHRRGAFVHVLCAGRSLFQSKTKQRLNNVIDLVKYVSEKRSMRVSTGQLNSLIADATMMNQPPSD